jgi:hypothetical protein
MERTLIACGLLLSAGACGGKTDAANGDVEASFEVVDDVEHADPNDPGVAGFFWSHGLGNWFVTTAAGGISDAVAEDIVPPRAESTRAYHVIGTEPVVSVDLWAQLDHPLGRGFDLSGYLGIAFWARSDAPSARVIVQFGEVGQFFKLDHDADTLAGSTLTLSKQWEQYIFLFDDHDVNLSSIASFDFVLGYDGEPLDFWIDDLALVCPGSCPSG